MVRAGGVGGEGVKEEVGRLGRKPEEEEEDSEPSLWGVGEALRESGGVELRRDERVKVEVGSELRIVLVAKEEKYLREEAAGLNEGVSKVVCACITLSACAGGHSLRLGKMVLNVEEAGGVAEFAREIDGVGEGGREGKGKRREEGEEKEQENHEVGKKQ